MERETTHVLISLFPIVLGFFFLHLFSSTKYTQGKGIICQNLFWESELGKLRCLCCARILRSFKSLCPAALLSLPLCGAVSLPSSFVCCHYSVKSGGKQFSSTYTSPFWGKLILLPLAQKDPCRITEGGGRGKVEFFFSVYGNQIWPDQSVLSVLLTPCLFYLSIFI